MEEGKKFDQGKPQLSLFPPSYWDRTNPNTKHLLSMSLWYWQKFFWEQAPEERFVLPVLNYDPMPVLEFGARKYSSHNWAKGILFSRIVDAFLRHCTEFNTDHNLWMPRSLDAIDSESGMPHGCHAACNLLFLQFYIYIDEMYDAFDDRPTPPQLTK